MKKIFVIIFLALLKVSRPVSAMSLEVLKKQVYKAELQNNIPKGALDTLITLESSYRNSAVNPMNYKKSVYVTSFGLGQITAATAKAYCNLKINGLKDPFQNISCAAKILRSHLDRFDNSLAYAVAAYNQGTPCVCDGKKYLRDFGTKIKVCKNFSTKKIIYCTKDQVGRFLNQSYVDNFLVTYKKLYPEIAATN